MKKFYCVSVVLQEQTFTHYVPGRLIGPFDSFHDAAIWLALETRRSVAVLIDNRGGRAQDGTEWHIMANEPRD